MKTAIRFLAVIVVSALLGSLSAQQGQGRGGQRVQKTPEETARDQVEWMKTDLKLDAVVQKKVYDVVLKYARQSSDERQKLTAAGDRDSLRAKMTEIMAARDKELKVILGEKDYQLFKTRETERRQALKQQREN
jgi:hypothetical protein